MDTGKIRVHSQSVPEPRSETKDLVGQKRGLMDVEETSENSPKRVKLRDLQSVICSEMEARRGGTNRDNTDSRKLELNVNAVSVDGAVRLKEETEHKHGHMKSKMLDLDLSSKDIFTPINDPFYPYKNYENLKPRDDSECGSSVGPPDEKDSMRVWRGLKQNNFMSTSYRKLPMPIPKPRGRKKNNNVTMKKKTELAKKEQVDRFSRIAAPSGLLNGLNPGIINHVRNSRQVYSILEAMVKSEREENRDFASKELGNGKEAHSLEVDRSRLSHEDILRGNGKIADNGLLSKSSYVKTEVTSEDDCLYTREMKIFSGMSSENVSCLSNEESLNLDSVNSLSIKAANVASQWLELLNQDIKGRLAALRRSKKRVQAVINTELPFLISKEFSSNTNKANADAHSIKWSTLFGQMDNSLSEEESHLERRLHQVKEMQFHCQKGLYRDSLSHPAQLIGPIGASNSRLGEVDNLEIDLAVRAAAASIYSTCNFLFSVENQPCF